MEAEYFKHYLSTHLDKLGRFPLAGRSGGQKKKMIEYTRNLRVKVADADACIVTAADKMRAAKLSCSASSEIIVLGRGHHIRNEDGTMTDVSNGPRYKCKQQTDYEDR